MSERSHRHNPAAHSRSRPKAREKGRSLSKLIGHIQLLISFASVPRQRWVPNRWKQTAAPLSSKRGTGRERSFFIEKAHSARRFSPQGHRVRAPCPNKRRKDCVCHRGSTHNLKRLASARHDREKTVLLPECTLQTKQSVKTKKRMMYSPGGPYIMVAPV